MKHPVGLIAVVGGLGVLLMTLLRLKKKKK